MGSGEIASRHGGRKNLPWAERFRRGARLRDQEEQPTPRYRYRTPVLTGPWRDTHADALRDAVNAKQARPDEDEPSGVKWIVPGEIEVLGSEQAARSAF